MTQEIGEMNAPQTPEGEDNKSFKQRLGSLADTQNKLGIGIVGKLGMGLMAAGHLTHILSKREEGSQKEPLDPNFSLDDVDLLRPPNVTPPRVLREKINLRDQK